jgi:hypothetical protein
MNARSVISMVLALLVPGAGHLYLGRLARAATYFVIVVFMFIVGLSVDGGLYTLAESQHSLLRILASLGSMGSGLMYFCTKAFGHFGRVTSTTYEYGMTFTLTAGLMNLLLVVDCYDIANGRKE